MSRTKKALDGRDAHIYTLRAFIGILTLSLLGTIGGWTMAPEHIKIDIPPDLRSGSTRGIGERHPFNVYAFGYYIFQQLNNWPIEGTSDYEKKINDLSCYFTPKYKGQLERDYEQRGRRNELNRSRYIQEIAGHTFNPKRVFIESKDSWVTYLDIEIKETLRSETIKDAFVRFPLRIVRWDVDPECNLWGLALDGFYGKPKRLEMTKQQKATNPSNDKLASN